MIQTNLPLVDLHRHLDGNIAPKTVWNLAQKHNIVLPTDNFQQFEKMAQVQGQTSDLLAFLEKLDYGVSVLADLDSVYQVAYENIADAKNQGLDYTELRFSPFYMAQAFKLDMKEVVATVVRGVKQGEQDFGVKTNLIGILSRTFGVDACTQELQAILANKEDIIALDLAGDELNFPAQMFVPHFEQAREAGLKITVHAGEAAGPESIWDAINLLGATRIGHGVAAIKDPKLMDYLVEHQIAVESCPTSNYQTATVTSLKSHPLPTFLNHGVLVCLNTDDPAVSNIDIKHEYKVAKEVIGLSEEQLIQVQKNGVAASFLSDEKKQELLSDCLKRNK